MQNTETRPFLKAQTTDATAALPQPAERPLVVARDAAGMYRNVGPDQPGNGTAARISQLVIQRGNLGGGNTQPMPDALVDLGRGTMFAPAGQLAGRNGGVIPKTISAERVFVKGLRESYDSLQPVLAAGNLRFLSPDVQRLVSGIAEASLAKHATDQGRSGSVAQNPRVSHLHPVASSPNAAHPDRLLKEVSRRTPFTRQDVEDAAKHHFSGSALNEAVERVLKSREVTRMDGSDGVSAFYSTRNMLTTERAMLASVGVMARNEEHRVAASLMDAAVGHGQTQAAGPAGDAGIRLSDEQVHAVRHVTGPEQITAIVGYAGAGKSTMLASARKAWEAAG